MIKDIIFQVYAGQKCKKMIDLVLNNFISEYEKLNLDYALPISNLDDNFNSEEEMISYFIEKKRLIKLFTGVKFIIIQIALW